MVGGSDSVVDGTCVSESLVVLANVVVDECDGTEDDEVGTPLGFVKVLSRRSLSSTVRPFEAGGLLTTLRFGTNMVGCLTVGSTAFEPAGCL